MCFFSFQTGPILQCNASSKRLTAGHWSNSRPGVFYIAKQDGTLDVWDLLDRTHEPSMSQSITPAPITNIYPWQVTSKYHYTPCLPIPCPTQIPPFITYIEHLQCLRCFSALVSLLREYISMKYNHHFFAKQFEKTGLITNVGLLS